MLHFALVKGIPCLIADLTLANIWGRFLPGTKYKQTGEHTEKWSSLPSHKVLVWGTSTQITFTK